MLSKGKCEVLHPGRNSLGTSTGWGPDSLGSSFDVEEDVADQAENKLTMSRQRTLVAKVASGTPGYIRKSVTSRLREVIFSPPFFFLVPAVKH